MKIPPSVLNKLDTVHCIIGFFLAKKKRLYCLFIDYEKAFDRVERAFVWQKPLDSGVDGRILTNFHERFPNVGLDFLTYHGLVSSVMTYQKKKKHQICE